MHGACENVPLCALLHAHARNPGSLALTSVQHVQASVAHIAGTEAWGPIQDTKSNAYYGDLCDVCRSYRGTQNTSSDPQRGDLFEFLPGRPVVHVCVTHQVAASAGAATAWTTGATAEAKDALKRNMCSRTGTDALPAVSYH